MFKRPKFTRMIQTNSALLAGYKLGVDKIAKRYAQEMAELDKKVEDMKKEGIYTQAYIDGYKMNYQPCHNYEADIDLLRNAQKEVILTTIARIEEAINEYLSAPVSQDFVNRMSLLQLTGVELTNSEIDTIKNNANYIELRTLRQVADSRKGAPYADIKVPDIEAIKRALNDYKNSAKRLLNEYAGENGELFDYMEQDSVYKFTKVDSATADAFIRCDSTKELTDALANTNLMVENGAPLTEEEKHIIDLIFDPSYPSLIKGRIKELSDNTEIIGLLERDERYADYVAQITA